jgi:hypothetical protein
VRFRCENYDRIRSKRPSSLPYSAHVDFKFTFTRVKRPGKAETQWMVTNTSDHFERVELKTIINGPCGYHREYNGGAAELNSGAGITDNWQADLTVLPPTAWAPIISSFAPASPASSSAPLPTPSPTNSPRPSRVLRPFRLRL